MVAYSLLGRVLFLVAAVQAQAPCLELRNSTLPNVLTSPYVYFDYTKPDLAIITCVGNGSTLIAFYTNGAQQICPPQIVAGPDGVRTVTCEMTCMPDGKQWSPMPPHSPIDFDTIYCLTVAIPPPPPPPKPTPPPINSACRPLINGSSTDFPISPFVSFDYSVRDQVIVTCVGMFQTFVAFFSDRQEKDCDSVLSNGPGNLQTARCKFHCIADQRVWSADPPNGIIDLGLILCGTIQVPDHVPPGFGFKSKHVPDPPRIF